MEVALPFCTNYAQEVIPRVLAPLLERYAREYPTLTLVGPRQSGKTTLVRHTFANHGYVNLEHPEARELATADPRGFFARHPGPIILDEIQRVPGLLSYVQVMVDESPSKGRFILTGSHQTALHDAVSQSLAGRTAVLRLLPLSLEELDGDNDHSLDETLLTGFFPRVHADAQDPTVAYRSYLQTYVERDLRQLINVRELSLFQKFLRLCAGRVGQLFNANALVNETGVSNHTIEQWLSVLETSFIVLRLQPYFENFNKRVTKSPKLYFTEVGLATYLLGLESAQQISRDPLRGALVENLVVMELIKARLNRAREPQLYFFRDNHGNEVDAVYKRGHELIPIEIKSAATYTPQFARMLDRFRSWTNGRAPKGWVVYGGDVNQSIGENELASYRRCASIVAEGAPST